MKDVMSFLRRLNYNSRFKAQSSVICEPIFKMLRKDAATSWTEECQKAFDKIKEYLSKPPVLVPLEPGRPLLLYLSVLDGAFGCIMGQHDETGRKEHAIYYLRVAGNRRFRSIGKPSTGERATKNTTMLPYLHCVQELIKRFTKIEFKHIPRIQNEFVDVLPTFSSMIQHPDKNFIDPILIEIRKHPAYCARVEEEFDGNPWFHDIKEYLEKREYPENSTHTQKRMLQDVVGPIEPATSNGHRFILVDIDYFTKWVEATSYRTMTKKVVADFIRDRIVCRFGVPESIFTDNAANLNSDLMKAMCATFKIKHRNSTAYKWQMNGVVEAANKNIKKILRKMVDNYKQWHEKLPFSLLGYRTIVCMSTGATPIYWSMVLKPLYPPKWRFLPYE
ncbi:uncharacterized protein [Nicotiana tomentosiformis]|uniref:uncharacterized protein n=1 Tax=Nicotiana tomentosiformis TaxID=4098 RepID=UPI00388C3E5F